MKWLISFSATLGGLEHFWNRVPFLLTILSLTTLVLAFKSLQKILSEWKSGRQSMRGVIFSYDHDPMYLLPKHSKRRALDCRIGWREFFLQWAQCSLLFWIPGINNANKKPLDFLCANDIQRRTLLFVHRNPSRAGNTRGRGPCPLTFLPSKVVRGTGF